MMWKQLRFSAVCSNLSFTQHSSLLTPHDRGQARGIIIV